MDITGLGTDIVEVARVEKLLKEYGDDFCRRICSADELALAAAKGCRATFFAGRWAAKEAAAKALGCGIGKDCALTDISVINDSCGKPELHFSGAAAETAAKCGVSTAKISISHESAYAVATVILCGDTASKE